LETLTVNKTGDQWLVSESAYSYQETINVGDGTFIRLANDGEDSWWKQQSSEEGVALLQETQWEVVEKDGTKWVNGAAASADNQIFQIGNLEKIDGKEGAEATTGALNPFKFLALIDDPDTQVQRWNSVSFTDSNGKDVKIYYAFLTPGNKILRPGLKFKVEGTFFQRLDFASLMLALFCGTAALPHILIRYYTVPDRAAVRKSTIVAIAVIGFFYILTLFMGLGAMTSAVVNPLDNNMSAPLLARSFSEFLFAVISAIAFATVLGTVSGLIIAASGAVAHDLMDRFAQIKMNEKAKVRAGKIAAIVVGIIAILLGILFQGMNVSFLVGLAFAVAASANLPAIVMVLYWKKTTANGVTASIVVGILAAVGLILLSPEMFARYGLDSATAPIPFNNPGIISIPLSFITLVGVSLLSKKEKLSEN